MSPAKTRGVGAFTALGGGPRLGVTTRSPSGVAVAEGPGARSPDRLVRFRVSEDVENFIDVPFLKTPLMGSGRTGTTPGSPTFGSPSSLFARTHP